MSKAVSPLLQALDGNFLTFVVFTRRQCPQGVQEGAGHDRSAELLSAAHEIRSALLSGETKAILDRQNRAATALANSEIFRVRCLPDSCFLSRPCNSHLQRSKSDICYTGMPRIFITRKAASHRALEVRK
jgi:hypothetical protein